MIFVSANFLRKGAITIILFTTNTNASSSSQAWTAHHRRTQPCHYSAAYTHEHPHTPTQTHTNPNTHIRIFYKQQTSDFHPPPLLYAIYNIIIINGVFRPPLCCRILLPQQVVVSDRVPFSCRCRRRRFASPRRNARFAACYVRCSLFGSFGDSLYTSSFSRSVYELIYIYI